MGTMKKTGDIFVRINESDEATVERIIQRLEFRDRDPTFTQWRESYFDKLPFESATRILDAGCGTGVVTRAIARRAKGKCQVVGSDYSPALIDAARQQAKEFKLDSQIDFQVNDIHSLDFEDDYFDIVIAHTVLTHVANPAVAVRELQRVVKPGGVVAIFDGDYASLTFAYPDDKFARQFEEAFLQVIVNNPRLMRNLPQLLSQVQLDIRDVSSHVLAEVGKASYWMSAIDAFVPVLASSGLLPDDKLNDWVAWQRQAVETGQFFAASNFYTYITQRADG
jgi:ubiquinone/menaquinone biosynthesis C-methylase UbiE